MTRKTIMLCPSGKSFEFNVRNINNGCYVEFVKSLNEKTKLGEQEKNILREIVNKWFSDREERLKNNLKLDENYPTAELQSIVLWLEGKKEKEEAINFELHLLPSESIQSEATAYITSSIIDKLMQEGCFPTYIKILETPLYQVLAIKVSTEQETLDSIDSLFKIYNKFTSKNDTKNNIVINATGGYKAICAFSAIYAQVHNLPCIYVFEGNTNNCIELPPLPIGYALGALDDEVSILKALKGKQWPGDFTKDHLPRWLSGLIEKNDKGTIKPSALADMLLKYYEENRFTAEAIGSGMLEQLTDEKLREYLKTCIQKNWSHLWIGDQIPETVEHSRRLYPLKQSVRSALP